MPGLTPAHGERLLDDIDAALARKDHEGAVALCQTALRHTDARTSILRKLVHATLGAGHLQDASWYARQLVRAADPPLVDDLILQGVVALACRQPDEAARCFEMALNRDVVHPLAALGLLRAAEVTSPPTVHSVLPRIVPALCWNAETSGDCLRALRGLVAVGLLPAVVFPTAGHIEGFATPGAVAELIWNRHILGRVACGARSDAFDGDAAVQAFGFVIPSALAGRVDFHVLVNGVAAMGSPIAAPATRFPRLAASFFPAPAPTTEDAAEWTVHAWDAAYPQRPVAIELRDDAGSSRRLVFRPAIKASASGEGGQAAFPQEVRTPASGVRPFFAVTGEPAFWQGGTLPAGNPEHRRNKPSLSRSGKVLPDRTVDVIVPVYGDADVTRTCLAALRHSLGARSDYPGQGIPVEVTVIADGPPDAAVTDLMDEVAAQGWATVLRNPGNLGFVRTVNRGMGLHIDRDVVLLNADTVVHGDWLRRLATAAYSADGIGTVTPLSNDATIVSYPSEGTPLSEVSVPFLDRLAAATLPGRVADIPTGVGFCFYIRRDCLEMVGYFDAETFGQGYGEENDFCWRARGQGWRHVVALNTLVGHVGGSSFGAEKRDRIQAALAALDRRHPDYQPAVHAFIAANPLAAALRALDLAWAQSMGPRPYLLLCPRLGGGTDRFVDEQVASLTESGVGVLLLRAEGSPDAPRVRLELPDAPQLQSLVYDGAAELSRLMRDLESLGVERMNVHHVLKASDSLLSALTAQWPYDVHAHDYVWICPRVNLVDGGDRYCGEPVVAVCEECIQTNGHRLRPGLSVTVWRRSMAEFLAGAARVICPSHDTARRLSAYAPHARMVVQPHPDVAMPPAVPVAAGPALVRVAVAGAIGDVKGYEVLLECARDAAARNLTLEFCLVGYSRDDDLLLATGRVLVTGRYGIGEGVELIRASGSHLGFLPSVWPETWCYTLSEMLAAGLIVAAFDLGAQAERLRARGSGMLLPLGMPVSQINDALLELARRQGIVPIFGAGFATGPASV